MSGKNLVRLLIVLAVLIGISLIVPRFMYRKTSKQVFAGIAADQLVRIVIKDKNEEEITLRKSDTTWQVITSSYNYLADKGSVQTILDAVKKLKIKDIISSNEKRHSRFEVTPGSGTHVRFYTSRRDPPRASFYIGKATPDYTNFYLRFEEEKEVYYSSGFSRYLVNKSLDRFRNRRIGATESNAVDNIVLIEGDRKQVLQRDGERWEYNDKEAEQKDVNSLVAKISSLNASTLVAPEDENKVRKDFPEKAELSLTIHEAGKKITLQFFPIKDKKKKETDKYHVLKKEENGIFIIHAFTINNIKDDFEKIKKATEKPPVEEKPPEETSSK